MVRETTKPSREYPWGLYVWSALFSVLWIVVVLRDQQYTLGEPNGRPIVASDDPLMYWGSIVFFAALFTAMVALCIRGELAYRKRKAEQDSGM